MRSKVVLAVASLTAVVFAGLFLNEWMTVRGLKRDIREALFAAMRPVRLANCTLERFGSPHDGGYLMCGNLLGEVQSAYSYGIHGDDNWGCDISKRFHVTTHQYDCFDLRRPACPDGGFDFHEECVGDANARIEARPFDTVANQVSHNGDTGKRLVVKMDVENAELAVLLATPDDLLGRIDQLAIELHRIDWVQSLRVMEKLKKTFVIAYVHANNYACPWGIPPFTSGANEVLFVNKRLAIVEGTGAATPAVSPLAAANYPDRPDCQPTWP